MVLSETRSETRRVDHQPLVCVVDDDAAMLRALRLLIAISGFCVETFTSAEAFLESRRARLVDCLVLDVHIGGLSGRDLQEGLASCRASIPVILITAHDDGPTQERARRGGAVEYLTKPFDEEALIDAIHRAIGRS